METILYRYIFGCTFKCFLNVLTFLLQAPEKFLFRGCKFQIKRGKESTGRVVIFRQLRILNSFTMEATFCGTTICKYVLYTCLHSLYQAGQLLVERVE